MAESLGNKKLDTLRDRACAKILWGEDEEKVFQFLLKEGISIAMAEEFIGQAQRERVTTIRKRCTIKFIAGLIGTIVCGGILGYLEFNPNIRFTGRGYYQIMGGLGTGFAVCGIFTLKNGWAMISGKTTGSALDD